MRVWGSGADSRVGTRELVHDGKLGIGGQVGEFKEFCLMVSGVDPGDVEGEEIAFVEAREG